MFYTKNEQGVFFRKHTEKEAKSLGLSGWCLNTPQGTVQGEAQGGREKLAAFRAWLANTGSPKSSITKAEFLVIPALAKQSNNTFVIRK